MDTKFHIGDVDIPVATTEDTWKYLGLSFSVRGVEGKPLCSMKEYLEKIGRAPLKPQQRLVVLRQYLLPRLHHVLILGKISAKILIRLDRAVRLAVRQWLRLPYDVPLGFYHAHAEDGGLGIQSANNHPRPYDCDASLN